MSGANASPTRSVSATARNIKQRAQPSNNDESRGKRPSLNKRRKDRRRQRILSISANRFGDEPKGRPKRYHHVHHQREECRVTIQKQNPGQDQGAEEDS